MVKKNADEAISNFSFIIKNYPTSIFFPFAYQMRGQAYLKKGNLQKAYNDFDFITKDRRISEQLKNKALLNTAKINFYKGNFKKASKILKHVISNKNDNSTNNALELSSLINTAKSDSLHLLNLAKADLLIKQENYDSAYSILKTIYSDKNTFFVIKAFSKFRFAQIEIALDSLNSALITLSEIIKEGKRNIFADKALFLKGKVYQFGLNNKNNAVKMYQELLVSFPNSIFVDKARKEILKLKK